MSQSASAITPLIIATDTDYETWICQVTAQGAVFHQEDDREDGQEAWAAAQALSRQNPVWICHSSGMDSERTKEELSDLSAHLIAGTAPSGAIDIHQVIEPDPQAQPDPLTMTVLLWDDCEHAWTVTVLGADYDKGDHYESQMTEWAALGGRVEIVRVGVSLDDSRLGGDSGEIETLLRDWWNAGQPSSPDFTLEHTLNAASQVRRWIRSEL